MNKRTILIIGGSVVLLIILLGVGFFVVGPMVSSANSQTPTPTPTIAVTSTATAHKNNPIREALKPNASAIQSSVAQGLHLSVTQLQADLKAGQTLSQIATAQNISATQLQTILSGAVQPYLNSAVTAGTLKQKQETAFLNNLQKKPDVLDHLLELKHKSA
jgi:predicted PurR-regulated permease PerM